ncbi:MAG: FkbM family methyltransferase [Planctomycetota bacterium]|jgi:FkbM family methyltransferase
MTRAFSCFADADPVITAQAYLWVNCLLRVQEVEPSAVFVHVPSRASAFAEWVRRQGVHVIEAEPFDARNRYCNKLQQLETFCDTPFEQVVLMDCDTAWVGAQPFPEIASVAAKIVDYANPPESVLRAIFAEAGLGEPEWVSATFPQGADRERTDANNCNGGLYVCAGSFIPSLAPRWRHWARWCLDHVDLFGASAPHVDQVGFALAMRELGRRVDPLEVEWNYPLHLADQARLPDVAPQVLHYHRELTPHLLLKTGGAVPTSVAEAVDAFNERIKSFLADDLVNAVFWDFRYATSPELGSGVGSRGEHLEAKRALLSQVLADRPGAAVVDVGCGDLEVTRTLSVADYTGLDVSERALQLAREKRPDWEFRLFRPGDPVPSADVVLCLDVLIHQPDEPSFRRLVDALASAAADTLVVSGYQEPPAFTSELTRYYAPLTGALEATGAFASVEIIGRYRDTVVVSATKQPVAPERAAAGPKVVVGSGWWCDATPHDWALGADATRSPEFFELWYGQILRCLSPERVVITDSASPVKPVIPDDSRVQWVELDRNYGHANDLRTGRIRTKYSGFTRSVLNGAMYALCCDADVYVYVEQDCLLYGDDFLAHALGDAEADILLGAPAEQARGLDGAEAAPMLQQSLIIVRRAGLERFVQQLLAAPWSDGEVPPEEIMRRQLAPFDHVRVPYGRSRPVDFTRSHFYVQHLDAEELPAFCAVAGARVPEAGGRSDALEALTAELDAWAREGLRARLWWRDDDAASDTPALRRLLALSERVGVSVGLAVIPSRADASLVAALAGRRCEIWQHGWRHDWTRSEPGGTFSHGEFGEGRSLEAMCADAEAGRRAMDALFGPAGWSPVFVPPFHALAVPFKLLLPSLGYRGLSAGPPGTPPAATVPEVNAAVDLIDWSRRRFRGAAPVAEDLVSELRARRWRGAAQGEPVGLLTHHLDMDAAAWSFTEELWDTLTAHPAAEFVDAADLFDPAPPPAGPRGPVDGAVTVVVTSCGRQDLLERTLDSFFSHNTDPVHEVIVVEDGDGAPNAALARKYRDRPMRWLETGRRAGQVAAIDHAYRHVATPYVFHCEDDWEFQAGGFIEKSRRVLEANPSILQVWLRGLSDTNRHPLLDHPFVVGGVHVRLLRHDHDAEPWGVWHGFSWNPGLRRLSDYVRLGGYGALDPDGTMESWQVESAAGEFYRRAGLFGAVLADRDGAGYVRHLGDGRRVPRGDSGEAPAEAVPGGTPAPLHEDLVFDVGAHRGEDSAYYLARGFRVVAVECDPDHAGALRERFAEAIAAGRLTLVEAAMAPTDDPVTFYRNADVGVWGTAVAAWAERNRALGTTVTECTVDGMPPAELFRRFGVPYYLKIDVEGSDLLVLRALAEFAVRPPYVSLETEAASMEALREEFAVLRELGYDRFKLSAQHRVGGHRVPAGSPHGRAVEWEFEPHASGLFGEDLPGPWGSEADALAACEPIMLLYDVERAIQRGVLNGEFKAFLRAFGHESGWYDTHARHHAWTGRSLGRSPASERRDAAARELQQRLAVSGAFARLPSDCGGRDGGGVDEVPEWQVWTDRPTTPDQLRIEMLLDRTIPPDARLLHIGVGNSSLAQRFVPRGVQVVGTTIHEAERTAAAALGLDGYVVACANKYTPDMDRLPGRFEIIVDNNPASFACCVFHFARLWVAFGGLLAPGGRVLTAKPGMHWVVTGNDPHWALTLDDWAQLAHTLGWTFDHLGDDVYALQPRLAGVADAPETGGAA